MRRLRRYCERRLEGVPIPVPFDLGEFCAGVARRRGRRLWLRGVPHLGTAAPCGLWIATGTADYVFYDPGTSRLHAEHIVLHELGHMLCGHSVATEVGRSVLSALVPDLDPAAVARVLGRVSYTTAQEREAELTASLIRTRAVRGESPAGPARGDALGRLAEALDYRG
ncbi:MAG TPA: hypothetical protein VNV66_00375 [Pilimelia sp.]|nr:hypothetical protein [Pilimelia sp.]